MINKLPSHLLILFCLLCAACSFGQSSFIVEQQHLYNSIEGHHLQLADSGYFSARTINSNNDDVMITRSDKLGQVMWQKQLALPGEQDAASIMQTSANRIVIGANTSSGFAVFFSNLNGNITSARSFSSGSVFYESERTDITESADHFIYALGTNHLVKMDSVGNVIWQRKLPVNYLNLGNIHCIDTSKIILTGFGIEFQSFQSSYDGVQICFDNQGTLQWAKSYGTPSSERLNKSIYAHDKIYSFGKTDDYHTSINGNFILCTDTNGLELWCKWIYDFEGSVKPVLMNDGTFAVVAEGDSGKVIICRYDEEGNFISGKKLYHTSPVYYSGSNVICTNDGGLYTESVRSLSSRTALKLNSAFGSSCLGSAHFSSTSNRAQILNEMPMNCSISSPANPTALNPVITPVPFTNIPICQQGACQVFSGFSPDRSQICQGEQVIFSDLSQGALSHKWFVDNVLTATSPGYMFTPGTPGLHIVKRVAFNGTCSDTTIVQIQVLSPLSTPVFSFVKEEFKVRLNTIAPDATTVTWNFGDGSADFYELDSTIHNFSSAGTYNVCLTENNVCGSVQACENITLEVDSIYRFYKHYNTVNGTNEGQCLLHGIATNSEGGYLISGIDNTFSNYSNGNILKTDKRGTPVWTHRWGSGDQSSGTIKVAEKRNGNIMVAQSTSYSPRLGLIDSTGTNGKYLALSNNYSSYYTGMPFEKPNGNIVYTGSFGSASFIMETDEALGIRWFKKHTAIPRCYASEKTRGGYIFTGTNSNFALTTVMKTDDEGDIIFARSYALTGSSSLGRSVATTADGFVIGGIFGNDAFLMRIDSLGEVIWSKKYMNVTNSSLGTVKSITVDSSGFMTVAIPGGPILKLDGSGNVIWGWKPQFPAVNHTASHDGGLAIAIQSRGVFYEIYEDMSLMKIAPGGNMPVCGGTEALIISNPIIVTASDIPDIVTTVAPEFTTFVTFNQCNTFEQTECYSSVPVPLSASFDVEENCAGEPLHFSNTSGGTGTIYQWSFESGSPATSTEENPNVLWTDPGNYTVTLISSLGGDSDTVTEIITVTDSPYANAGANISICKGDTVVLSGSGTGSLSWVPSFYLTSINPQDAAVFPILNRNFILSASLNGCTAYDTISVQVRPSYIFTTSSAICEGETYQFRGNTYDSPGQYDEILSTITGCDSTFRLLLSVHSINADVTVSGVTLSAAEIQNASYDWFDCNTGEFPFNSWHRNFSPAVNGNYAVIISLNGCSDTSDCYPITTLDLAEGQNDEWIAYPVPAEDVIYLKCKNHFSGEIITLSDESGKIVLSAQLVGELSSFSIKHLAKGIYSVRIGKSPHVSKIIKQ